MFWVAVVLEACGYGDAVGVLVERDHLDAAPDIGALGQSVAKAYPVIAENVQLTDLQLADIWLYSDALHAQLINSAVGNDLGLDERYRAAAGVYARLGAAVSNTYALFAYLAAEGLIELDKAVLTERVIAGTRFDELIAAGYSAPAGAARCRLSYPMYWQ